MTTATVFGKRGAVSPATEPGGNDAGTHTATVMVTLRGTVANINTDFTTITGTSWASSTVEVSWQQS